MFLRAFMYLGFSCLLLLASLIASVPTSLATPNPMRMNERQVRASQRQVTGQITANGIPLSGVTVKVEGQSATVTSGTDGEYSITASQGDVLVFSAVGYQKQQVKVGQLATIDVALQATVSELDEVVVVGYGSQKKSDVTNAVSTIDFEDLQNIPQSNTVNVLAGRVAGLSAIQAEAHPGNDDTELVIRGVSSTGTGWSSPLVIIDGVESWAKDLAMLSPSEIKSVSVLKDASSAAIYGARGANGVILVTTRSPQGSNLRIQLNSYMGLQKATYLPQFVESWQWMTLHNEASRNDEPIFPEDAIEAVKNRIYTDTFANYDPVEGLFRIAPQTSHNLTIAGGTKDIAFQGSLGYLNQQGVMVGTRSDRYNFRANTRAVISPKLEAGLNLSGYFQNNHENSGGVVQVMRNLLRSYPITPEKYGNGDWGVYNLYTGESILPARLLAETGRKDDERNSLNVQPFLEYRPVKNLTLTTRVAYNNTTLDRENFLPTYEYPIPDGRVGIANRVNTLENRHTWNKRFQITNTALYRFAIKKKSQFSILGGYEFINNRSSTIEMEGSDLPTNAKQVLDQVTTNIIPGGDKQEQAYESIFGRLNYTYQSKYLLEGNIRMDGSSRVPIENRYNTIYSFSGGWMLSNEKFFSESSLASHINEFKIRYGWGMTRNDVLGNRPYKQRLDFSNYYYFGEELFAGAAILELANPQLNWVMSTSQNLGVDISILNRQLDITFDLYDRLVDGVIYQFDAPPSFGVEEKITKNAAKVSNKGWEFSARYNSAATNRKKLSYHVAFNISYNKNRVLSVDQPIIQNPFMVMAGEAFNSYYGLVYDGVIKNQAELDTVPVLTSTRLEVGSMKFKDLNKDGKIDANDRTVLGSSAIPYEYGISGGIAYKGLELNFLLHGVQGKQIYIKDDANTPNAPALTNFWKEWWDNRYDAVNNPTGTWPVLMDGAPGANEVSSFYVHNASFLRVKNVEIGYSFPKKVVKQLSMNGLRLYVAGQNMFTFSPLIKQIDPERKSRTTDNRRYPQAKIMTFGLNLTL